MERGEKSRRTKTSARREEGGPPLLLPHRKRKIRRGNRRGADRRLPGSNGQARQVCGRGYRSGEETCQTGNARRDQVRRCIQRLRTRPYLPAVRDARDRRAVEANRRKGGRACRFNEARIEAITAICIARAVHDPTPLLNPAFK